MAVSGNRATVCSQDASPPNVMPGLLAIDAAVLVVGSARSK